MPFAPSCGTYSLDRHHLLHDEVMAFVLQDGRVTVKTGLASAETIHRLTEQLRVQPHRLHARSPVYRTSSGAVDCQPSACCAGLHDALFAPLRGELHHEFGDRAARYVAPAAIHAFFGGSRYVVDDFVAVVRAQRVSLCAVSNIVRHRPADPRGDFWRR